MGIVKRPRVVRRCFRGLVQLSLLGSLLTFPSPMHPLDRSPRREGVGRDIFRSIDGSYVFPVAIEPSLLGWKSTHWDESAAVDIRVAESKGDELSVWRSFEESAVVAVVDGTVERADNERGGIAVQLRGDDGFQYYYAHLDRTNVVHDRRVKAGEIVGEIGRTGLLTQYLEEHLHFSILSRHQEGLRWRPDVSASDWLLRKFGLPSETRPSSAYPPAYPVAGVARVPILIVADSATTTKRYPGLGGVWVEPQIDTTVAGPFEGVGVYSTLTGEVTVHRRTPLGLRVQITNRHTEQSVIYSALAETWLLDGDVVSVGERIGEFSDALHYAYFDNGQSADPIAQLRLPADR